MQAAPCKRHLACRHRASGHLNVAPYSLARALFAVGTWQMPHVQAGPCTGCGDASDPLGMGTLSVHPTSPCQRQLHLRRLAVGTLHTPQLYLRPPCACDALHPHQLHLRRPPAAATASAAPCRRQAASAAACRRQATSAAACRRQATSAETCRRQPASAAVCRRQPASAAAAPAAP